MKKTIYLFAFAVAGQALAGTVELSPSADVTISQAQASRNFGSDAVFAVAGSRQSASRALLRFDVGGNVPPGATITSASLRLESVDDQRDNTFQASLHRMNQFWNEGRGTATDAVPVRHHEVTWSHRVHFNGRWSRAGGARGIDFSGRQSADWNVPATGAAMIPSSSRLVADVQSWLDRPYTNEGWMLIAASGRAAFASREDETRAPKLIVEYSMDDQVSAADGAEYEVEFVATWSTATHPRQFPANAHWSGLVGGVHNQFVSFWRRGTPATEGIRRMAELGAQSTLLSEVATAIGEGTAASGLSGSGISSGRGRTSLRFSVNRTHPLATVTSMVAPSPDWFVGVRNLPLLERGRWVARKSVPLFPYDAGTDSGATFQSADVLTDPRGVISRIITPPLANSRGYVRPMGRMIFRRIDTAGN